MFRILRIGHAGEHPPAADLAALDDRLRLFTQPIVHLGSGQVVAEELLPMLAVGDRSRLGRVEEWLVYRAASVAASGRNVHVALSAKSVRGETFATCIEAALLRTSADPDAITFEIGEGVAARDTEVAARFASRLADLGVRLAINGVALRDRSANYVERIPATALKIHPWVVRGAPWDRHAACVLYDIVRLGQRHGVSTIAEGVESEDLVSLLRLLRVDCAQGFHRQRRNW